MYSCVKSEETELVTRLECGHTFCYSCLVQWFTEQARKKCPECRHKVKVKPEQSYVLRDIAVTVAEGAGIQEDLSEVGGAANSMDSLLW